MTTSLTVPTTALRPLLLGRENPAAVIVLSRHFSAGIAPVADHPELTLHQAWDQAAANLIREAQKPAGTQFLVRPVGAGLEIRTRGSEARSWLAHPSTFTVVHKHLRGLLGFEPSYRLGRYLVAAPHREGMIRYRHGFPSLY